MLFISSFVALLVACLGFDCVGVYLVGLIDAVLCNFGAMVLISFWCLVFGCVCWLLWCICGLGFGLILCLPCGYCLFVYY